MQAAQSQTRMPAPPKVVAGALVWVLLLNIIEKYKEGAQPLRVLLQSSVSFGEDAGPSK